MMSTATRPRRLGLALIAGTGLLGLTACSSGDSGSTAGPSAVAPAPTSAAQVRELVLPADQFPAGFNVQEIPEEQTGKAVEQLRAATEGAKVSPANCAEQGALPKNVDVSKVALAVATKGSVMVSAGVNYTDADLPGQRASIAKCDTMTMTFTSGPTKGVTSKVTQKVVTAPKVRAKEVLVVDQVTLTTSADGQRTETSGRVGSAEVNGYLVTVQYRSLNGKDVDEKTFDDIFVKAVDHVVEKTS